MSAFCFSRPFSALLDAGQEPRADGGQACGRLGADPAPGRAGSWFVRGVELGTQALDGSCARGHF